MNDRHAREIAKALRDPILFGVGTLGVLAGLVEFLIHYP